MGSVPVVSGPVSFTLVRLIGILIVGILAGACLGSCSSKQAAHNTALFVYGPVGSDVCSFSDELLTSQRAGTDAGAICRPPEGDHIAFTWSHRPTPAQRAAAIRFVSAHVPVRCVV